MHLLGYDGKLVAAASGWRPSGNRKSNKGVCNPLQWSLSLFIHLTDSRNWAFGHWSPTVLKTSEPPNHPPPHWAPGPKAFCLIISFLFCKLHRVGMCQVAAAAGGMLRMGLKNSKRVRRWSRGERTWCPKESQPCNLRDDCLWWL